LVAKDNIKKAEMFSPALLNYFASRLF